MKHSEMCPRNMDAPLSANRKQTYDRPEKRRLTLIMLQIRYQINPAYTGQENLDET